MSVPLRARAFETLVASALLLACLSRTSDAGAVDAGAQPLVGEVERTSIQDARPATVTARPAEAGTVLPEGAPAATGLLPAGDAQRRLDGAADAWLQSHATRRLHLQLDKPLYQPGETVWFRLTSVSTRSLQPAPDSGVVFQLVNPQGATVEQKRVRLEKGVAANDFALDEGLAGGEYKLVVATDTGERSERTFTVSAYEAPRFKKTLEFVRKAYGPGDIVSATIEVRRPTGEPFTERAITGVLTLDGLELPRVTARTDARGAAVVSVPLPAAIERGDGLLTVLVEDAGVTESISKRVPVVLRRLKLSLYPEGGDLVAGLPSRVYFAAQTLLDAPADVSGRVVDDHGQAVATFASVHDGLGRFTFTPATGRRYHVQVTKPAGVGERFDLPLAMDEGCTLRTFDDPEGEAPAIRAQVRCTEAREVVLTAVLREERIASTTAQVTPERPAVVHLAHAPRQGVARVTLFSRELEPLAERLVYRGLGRGLQVKVKPARTTHTPSGEVVLEVETRDASGKPVSAELGMSAVDDTVLSFADDKTGHLLAHTFLQAELQDEVKEPNLYLKAQGGRGGPLALELLLGTRGWRRFEWQQVLHAPQPRPGLFLGGWGGRVEEALPVAAAPEADVPAQAMMGRPVPAAPRKALAPQLEKADKDGAVVPVGRAAAPVAMARLEAKKRPLLRDDRAAAGAGPKRKERFLEERALDVAQPQAAWAKVRVFPVPPPQPDYAGAREDFRETVYWNPRVRTDARGRAQVRFTLSDAVTSFRVTTEGFGGGAAGRDETVIASKLPFFMDVKLPLEVSAGDRVLLPLTLRNETDGALAVDLAHSLGKGVKLLEVPASGTQALAAGGARTLTWPLEVTGTGEASVDVSFRASAQGLSDEFKRTLRVVPPGYPRSLSFSGTLERRVTRTLNLERALPGSVRARVTLYPSPLATLVSGLESILAEPNGCFEQTSSTTYPNVMVMRYLEEQKVAAPAVLARASGLVERGYQKLHPYETPTRGFEWFGGAPGHEALTAYGLMEFRDMKAVYPEVDDAMVARTAAWLLSRRDGKGGFQRNARALDSFGAASPAVTDAYIVWALTEAGHRKDALEQELAAVTRSAEATDDAYVLALATRAQLNTAPGGSAGKRLVHRLASLQKEDGHFVGTTHSITRSGGHGLMVETTALSVLALLSSGEHPEQVRRAVQWLASARGGSGGFGSTQATVLALKALVEYDRASARVPTGGTLVLRVNGREVARSRVEPGSREPLVLEGFADALRAGPNALELTFDGPAAMPYAVAVDYSSLAPASSPEAPVRLSTELLEAAVKMGETVRVKARLESNSAAGLPMALLRVGIPGGTTFRTGQLKELVERKAVDFYETRPREVILYWRALEPRARREVVLDLVATVPGEYTAPASSAYLYYTAEHRAWAAPLKVRVDR